MNFRAAFIFGLLVSFPLAVLTMLDPSSRTIDQLLPSLAGLPLFAWLGSPWKLRAVPERVRGRYVAPCLLGMLFGFVGGVVVLIAAAWTVLLWVAVHSYVEPDEQRPLKRLLLIPFLSVPWILMDGQWIGLWFRLTGAWVSEWAILMSGADVARAGTLLYVNETCISVEEACAGLSTLHSMLLGGAVLAYAMLSKHRSFWWHAPIIVIAAWLANTFRVALTGLVAVHFGPAYATGWLHEWQGLFLLGVMFVVCSAAFTLLLRLERPTVAEAQT